jgi:alpha-L-arabinofuranosidase
MSKRLTITQQERFAEPISPLIYGEFIELLNDLIPGMWADKVQDRSFAGVLQPEQVYPPGQNWVYPRWHPITCATGPFEVWPAQPSQLDMIQASSTIELDHDRPWVGDQCARVTVEVEPATANTTFVSGIAQDGLALKQGQPLNVELYMRGDASTAKVSVTVLVGRNYGVFFRVYDGLEFTGLSEEWQQFSGTLTSGVTDDQATLAIGLPGGGTFWVGKVSLMPGDNLHGWRPDVVEAVRALNPGIIRFGGSSLIYYDWRIGVGPRARRAAFENRPWGNREENDVGLHEFLQFCELVAAKPLICLNSNSASIEQILEEIEYCNGPADSKWGSWRSAMGHPASFHVQYWQIGNEQSGEEYERRMVDYARAIRARYPELTLLASYPSDNILQNLSGEIDYVCPHIYAPYSESVEDEVRVLIDAIQSRAQNRKLRIAVTEWNHTGGHWGWARTWLLTLFNALNAARMFNLYQRHADMIHIANLSNMTNSCNSGTIQTSPSELYFTPTYFVQKAYANLAGDRALQVEESGDELLDVTATLRSTNGELALFVVNYTKDAQTRMIDFQPGRASWAAKRASVSGRFDVWTLAGPGLDAVNSLAEKTRIAPIETNGQITGELLEYEFPPYSLTVLRM